MLNDSVAAHAISDVPPIALFLSGGLDSAVLGYFATKAGVDITAYTVALPGLLHDEAADDEWTARVFGLRHKVIDASGAPDFDAFFDAADQPSIDGLNTYIVAGVAAREGFRSAEWDRSRRALRRLHHLQTDPDVERAQRRLPENARRRILSRVGGNRSKAPGLAGAGRSFASAARRTQVSVHRASGGITDRRSTSSALHRQLMAPSNRPISRMNRRPPFTHPSPRRGCLRDGSLPRAEDTFATIGCSPPARGPRTSVRSQPVSGRSPERWAKPDSQRSHARRSGGFRLPFKEWLAGALRPRVEAPSSRAASGRLGSRDARGGNIRRPCAGCIDHAAPGRVVLDAWMRRNALR